MTSWVLLKVGGCDGDVQELVIDWLVPKVALAVAGQLEARSYAAPSHALYQSSIVLQRRSIKAARGRQTTQM
jgi:hypothetical protein